MRATHYATVAIMAILVSGEHRRAHKLQSPDAASSTAPPEFEVASNFKLNTECTPTAERRRTGRSMRLTASGARNGRYTMRGFGAPTVSVLIQAAHNVKEFQVVGAPGG